MTERNRPVYCRRCGSIVQAGDNFCGVCGAQVMPPQSGSTHGTNRTLAAVFGVAALLVAVLAVGAIVGLNLPGSETAERSERESGSPATTQTEETTQIASQRDEEPETLGMEDSVEMRGVRATLNEVRVLPTNDLDQPIESPDNLFVATDLTFENTSDETVAVSSLLEFILKDEDGYSTSQTVHSQQRQLAEGDMAPGEKSSGEIVYEVPPESKG